MRFIQRIFERLREARVGKALADLNASMQHMRDSETALADATQRYRKLWRGTGGRVPDDVAAQLNGRCRAAQRRLDQKARRYTALSNRRRESATRPE